ncbi:14500_t:CDS:2, partial [Cetraspora pellucida]
SEEIEESCSREKEWTEDENYDSLDIISGKIKEIIPTKHYKKIEENSSRLKVLTNYLIIIEKFNNEILINHKQRRKLDKENPECLRIEKENHAFLENYYEVYEVLTFWYGYYLYQGIGCDIDKEKASKLYKIAADEDVAISQLHYAFSLIDRKKQYKR